MGTPIENPSSSTGNTYKCKDQLESAYIVHLEWADLGSLILSTKKFKAVIFDLDHTLIRSHIDFHEMKANIVNYLRDKLPSAELDDKMTTYEVTRRATEFMETHGLSKDIPKTVSELNRIMTNTEMKYVSNAALIEGAAEALKKLKAAGMKIGILTRACREYANQTLKTTGLATLVDEVAARDDCDNPKPDPSQVYWLMEKMKVKSDNVIMVGDHPIDSLCARNAGISFVGVLTGSWGAEQVEQLGPNILPSVKQLPEYLGVRPKRGISKRDSHRSPR
jgi:HAD superfamily hydrolase (TIGR01549 family)